MNNCVQGFLILPVGEPDPGEFLLHDIPVAIDNIIHEFVDQFLLQLLIGFEEMLRHLISIEHIRPLLLEQLGDRALSTADTSGYTHSNHYAVL